MTTDRDFDRIAGAWLATSPDEAPDRAIAAILQAVETTPQVRSPWRWLTWRSTTMNRIPLAIGAAAVVAIAGAFVFFRSSPAPTVGSSPTPGATPSASPSGSPAIAAGGPVPSVLRASWMGDHRGLVGLAPEAGTMISIDQGGFYLAQSAGSSVKYLESSASTTSDGRLRLELAFNSADCDQGDIGTYAWTISPSGRILTITEDRDDCPTRGGALEGVWWLMDCPFSEDNCLGAVDSGTYKSQFITPRLDPGAPWSPVFGAVTYTVPDGWANVGDWPGTLDLVPVSEPLADAPNWSRAINLNTQPSAMNQDKPCSDTDQPGVTRSVDALVTWLQTVPGLVTTTPTAITIDGHPGQWVDIRLDPAWKKKCADGTGPIVTYMMPGTAVKGTERERLILVDLGDGDVLQILVWTKDQAAFDGFIPDAMAVIESFRFK
jgi:hypothetical protein